MFCKRCGTQLPDDARFCPGCGLDLGGVSRPPVRQEAGPKSEPGPEPGPKSKKEPKVRRAPRGQNPSAGKGGKLKKLLIPAAVAVLAVVSVSLFLKDRKVYQLPDPAAFFGQEAKDVEKRDGYVLYTFLFEGDPVSLVEAYEDLLNAEEYELLMIKTSRGETSQEYLMSHSQFLFMGSTSWSWNGVNAVQVEDWLLDSGAHAVEVSLYNPEHLEFTPQGRYQGPGISGASGSSGGSEGSADLVQAPVPEEAPPEEPAPPAVDLSGPVAPDLESFSGGALAFLNEHVYLNHTERIYAFHNNDKFIKEYLDLLEDYGFTPKQTYDDGHNSVCYSFDYAGEGAVETFTPSEDRLTGPVALYLWVIRYEVHIYYGDGITYTDTGDRTGQSLTPYEGSSASSASSSIDWSSSSDRSGNVPQIRCTRCLGDKEVECPECRGRGTLSNYGSTPNYSGSGRTSYSAPKDCPNCVGGKIECPRCHGTGWE